MHFRKILRLFRLHQWPKQKNATPTAKRTILLISGLSSECNSVRVFSLIAGWHLIFAPNVSAAVERSGTENVTVVLYDEDVPGMPWQEGVHALLNTKQPAFLILLSSAMCQDRRAELVRRGGYDVVRKPVRLDTLARLIDGCWTLMNDVDAAANRLRNRGAVVSRADTTIMRFETGRPK